jgi:hypothetical protein
LQLHGRGGGHGGGSVRRIGGAVFITATLHEPLEQAGDVTVIRVGRGVIGEQTSNACVAAALQSDIALGSFEITVAAAAMGVEPQEHMFVVFCLCTLSRITGSFCQKKMHIVIDSYSGSTRAIEATTQELLKIQRPHVGKETAVVFDLDDTLIQGNGNPITPWVNVMKTAHALDYPVYIITARADGKDNREYTFQQVRNLLGGIDKMTYIIMRPPQEMNIGAWKDITRRDLGKPILLAVGNLSTDLTNNDSAPTQRILQGDPKQTVLMESDDPLVRYMLKVPEFHKN